MEKMTKVNKGSLSNLHFHWKCLKIVNNMSPEAPGSLTHPVPLPKPMPKGPMGGRRLPPSPPNEGEPTYYPHKKAYKQGKASLNRGHLI
jgi:hypothetical protein